MLLINNTSDIFFGTIFISFYIYLFYILLNNVNILNYDTEKYIWYYILWNSVGLLYMTFITSTYVLIYMSEVYNKMIEPDKINIVKEYYKKYINVYNFLICFFYYNFILFISFDVYYRITDNDFFKKKLVSTEIWNFYLLIFYINIIYIVLLVTTVVLTPIFMLFYKKYYKKKEYTNILDNYEHVTL